MNPKSRPFSGGSFRGSIVKEKLVIEQILEILNSVFHIALKPGALEIVANGVEKTTAAEGERKYKGQHNGNYFFH
jgi:hypothetical protein